MDDVSELVGILDLERIELDMFRGQTPAGETRRIYGGQVVAQALTAAYKTIETRICHSLHAYFIRPGDPKLPILYKVERVRDGGTFSTRRVIAIQHGSQIFNLAASFQVPETGFEELHAKAAENSEWSRRIWPVEVRPVDPPEPGPPTPHSPDLTCWFRARGRIGEGVGLNQGALAYASDLTLLDASLRPHAVDWSSGRLQVASLDHALWFHRPSDLTQWHLYVQDSPSASGGRGFNRGEIYSRDGVLVASAAQEALIRYRQGDAPR